MLDFFKLFDPTTLASLTYLRLSHLIYGLNLQWRGVLKELLILRWGGVAFSFPPHSLAHSLSTILACIRLWMETVWLSSSKTDERTVICHLCNGTERRHWRNVVKGDDQGRGERSNRGRGGTRVTSALSSPSLPWVFTVMVWSAWRHVRSQCQDVRGFTVDTFRERGERDAEIEMCLLAGNPINQHMNISLFPSLSLLLSFKTISESFAVAHNGGHKFFLLYMVDFITEQDKKFLYIYIEK